MIRAGRYVLLLLLLLLGGRACCRDFPSLHYTIDDGLPSNIIYQVYRDSHGYIWVSTDKGLARHNGIKFEVFTTFNGLPDNEIFFVQEDKLGRMWLGTFNGSLCYYQDGVFHTAANTPLLKGVPTTTHIRVVALQDDSSVVVMFNDPSIFLNIDKESADVIDLKKLNNKEVLQSLVYIKKLSPTKYKLFCKDRSLIIDNTPRITDAPETEDTINDHINFAITQGQIYLYNKRYFYTADQQAVYPFPAKLNVSSLHGIYLDGATPYISTSEGLFIGDTVHLFRTTNITAVTTDLQGNYWVSTLNNGVFVLGKGFFSTALYKSAYDNEVKYAYAVKGNIFYATSYNDLFCLQHEQLRCLFSYRGYKHEKYHIPTQPGFLIDSSLHYYDFYNDDYLRMDNLLTGSPKITHNPMQDGMKVVLASGPYIYVMGSTIISRLDLNKYKEGGIKFDVMKNNMPNERIFSMAKDNDGNIWYATINNIYKVVGESVMPQPQFKNVTFKSFDFTGRYLVGYTHDNLLLVCSNIEGKVTVDSMLSQNCIWDRFYRLDPSHLLISTNGDYRLFTVDESKKAFSVSAVQNAFIPQQAEYVCADGQDCYFFKNGAITVASISNLTRKPMPPKLYFTSLKTGKGNYHISDNMQLSYGEAKNISISFSTVSLSGKDIIYQYSVSRNDQDSWRELKNEQIDLFSSGYGNYTIKVRARSLSSDYCAPIVLILNIPAPFWASWWFILLAICLAVGLAALFIRLRVLFIVRKRERRHKDEIKYMKSEYKALNALMNPHFIFNTLNNVQSLFNEDDKRAANEYLRVFADLIRQNMHNVSKELITLQKEIILVTNYLRLEQMRFEEKLAYTIEVDDEVDLTAVMIPPLLIQPLVENSIKHGILPMRSGAGTIALHIYEDAGKLYIQVKDNGVGIQSKKSGDTHESFGLENIRTRVAQLSVIQNKEISFDMSEQRDETGALRWTIVTISIPL